MKFNIFVDGIEGSGKTFLISKMAKELQDRNVKIIKFPSDDFRVKYLRQDVEPPGLNGLFYMDMMAQLKSRGDVDICLYDRSFLSPIVYNPNMKREYIDALFEQLKDGGVYNLFIFIDILVSDARVSIKKRKKPFNNQNAKNFDNLELIQEDYYNHLEYAYEHCNRVICLESKAEVDAFDIKSVLKGLEDDTQ